QDGHTTVWGTSLGDTPLLKIEPIEGKPVVTEVGTTDDMQASGISRGMELIEVNGMPIEQILKNEIYPYISASTPQSREVLAFNRLLRYDQGTSVSATFLDLKREKFTVDLVCDLRRHRDAAFWINNTEFEFKKLPGGISYTAINGFGSKKVVEEFDKVFDKILASKSLIIDVRNNGGGSTGNANDIIARLIDKTCHQVSKWRTREYKPTFYALGREQEWYEGDHDAIEPRGERAFLGPVVVLIGPKTFSAAEDFLVPLKASGRATLIGEPTGGSTGQPLFFNVYDENVYEARAAICTKWDRYSDGTEFVGVGIQPDIPVERTRQDIFEGKDPVLTKAMGLLTQN
ncbi:S41 family peptidase, partial [Gemmatimonadota bacterium]